jgi:hypothetical protein
MLTSINTRSICIAATARKHMTDHSNLTPIPCETKVRIKG